VPCERGARLARRERHLRVRVRVRVTVRVTVRVRVRLRLRVRVRGRHRAAEREVARAAVLVEGQEVLWVRGRVQQLVVLLG